MLVVPAKAGVLRLSCAVRFAQSFVRLCAGACVLAATLLVLPITRTAAQGTTKGGGRGGTVTPLITLDTIAPSVWLSAGGTYTTSPVSLTVNWCDNNSLDATSRQVLLRGSPVTSDFTLGTAGGCTKYATSTAALNLTLGANAVNASISDNAGNVGSASGTFTYAPYLVTVTSDTATVVRATNAAGAEPFTIHNIGSKGSTYTLSAACGLPAFASCAVPRSVTVGAGQSVKVTATYITGTGAGSGLSVTAVSDSDATEKASGTMNVTFTAATYGLTLTADSSAISRPSRTDGVQTFTLRNSGNTITSFNLAVTCATSLFTGCSAPAVVQVANGQTAKVSLGYTTAVGPASGSLTLQATAQLDGTKTASASTSVTVQSVPLVALVNTLPGTRERSQCLAFGIVESLATDCGTIRVTHPLPTVTTYDKARTPTLVYYTDAVQYPVIGADVTPRANISVDSVTLALYQVSGGSESQVDYRKFTGWSCNGCTQRIAGLVSPPATRIWKIHAYVKVYSGGGATPDTGSAFTEIPEVYRVGSKFGAGWWLAGVEQLVFSQPDTAGVLWIGGDESTRKYTWARYDGATNRAYYVAPSVTRPDTLVRSLAAADTGRAWYRILPMKDTVFFNSSGWHVKTVSHLGYATQLAWTAGSGTDPQLESLTVPGGLTYRWYHGTSVDSIVAPKGDVYSTTTKLYHFSTSTNNRGDSLIVDPSGASVKFTFFSWGPDFAYNGRTNRRGTYTHFEWEGYSPALSSASTPANPTQTVVQTFRNAYAVGAPPGTAPLVRDSVYTRYTDPRGNVTKFWVNELGAPIKIINAIGQATTIRYTDARFPGLATEAVSPSGVVTRAWYNARGLVDSATTFNPYGDGRNSTTSYGWDATFPAVISATTPEGETSTRGLDASMGTVLWAQSGGDTTRFHYNASHFVDSVLTSDGAVDKYGYDGLLNLAWHERPNKHRELLTRDAIGRVTADTTYTAKWVTVNTTQYDYAGRISQQLSHAVRDSATGAVPSGWEADVLGVNTYYDNEDNPTTITQTTTTGRVSTPPSGGKLASISRWFTYDSLGRKTREWSAGDDVSWTYDVASNVVSGGRGMAGTLAYDALNRVIARTGTADSARFTYDALTGGLRTANNLFAHITRTYFPNGALKGDTTSLANAAMTAFDSTYGTALTYDRDGRRTSLKLPGAVGGSMTYTYDPRTGQLATITDRNGMRYRYHYDLQGRLDSLMRRDGRSDQIVETRAYDVESNAITDNIVGWNNETRGYDALNRLVTVNGTTVAIYDPLGHAVMALHNNATQDFFYDALGNRAERQSSGWGGTQDADYWYFDNSNQLVFERNLMSVHADSTLYLYDARGSLVQSTHDAWFGTSGGTLPDSGYIKDQHSNSYRGTLLVESDRWRDTVWIQSQIQHQANPYQNWETYHYDALGRRVWQKMIYNGVCQYVDGPSGCTNSITNTVWDGSAILLELRTDTLGTVPVGGNFGLVSYVHGGETDRPLAILKNGQHDVLPFTDWTNSYTFGGCPTTFCGDTDVIFPAKVNNVFGAPIDQTLHPANYYGSIINGMADGSGYVYQRNRYLDPASGKFIQVDPMGLAGGLNVYGFAGGDPVNYSDPFGLCIFGLPCPQGFVNAVAGFGDGASFGLSRFIRQHTGGGDGVDYGSKTYNIAEAAGQVATTIATDGAGSEAAGAEVGTAEVGGEVGGAKAAVRTEPANLSEQLTMEEAKSGAGEEIMKGKIKDPKYPADKWAKMSHTHENPDGSIVEVHYWKNRSTGATEGYKFKNDP